ncbi:MAG: hypothetical protein P1U36_07630 [Legionellaceae bacterium]|nr:hypothetical protein [Legionellaceae bacterium]
MPLPFLAAASVALATTKTIAGNVGAIAMYTYPFFYEKPLPEMIDAIDNRCNEVHADSDALVIDTAKQLKQDEEKTDQGHANLEGVVTRLGSEVTTMEEREEIPVIPSPESHAETLRRLTDAQARTDESVSRQQVDISAISEKLDNLPALLRVNQENKMLRLENEQLKKGVKTLEAKVIDGLACIEELTDFANEQQVEIEALQSQLRAKHSVENKENAPASVSFFART